MDPVFDHIDKEHERQVRGVELIASENYVSPNVLKAMGSCLTNKYAEGYPGKRYYGGCEHVDSTETLAIDRLKELFGVSWANVQPHSGANANLAVFFSVCRPGDTIMGLGLNDGGHLTHGGCPINFSATLYNAINYHVDEETGILDYDQIASLIRTHKPRLFICGGSAYARDWDYERLRALCDETSTTLMADISHFSGLLAAKLVNDPVPHCHVITSTTHKTLRGPRGGIIMIGNDTPNPLGIKTPKGTRLKRLSEVIDSTVFPGLQGGPLEHIIAAKAVCFGEALQPSFRTYAQDVIKNARILAEEFQKRDYKVVTNGTDTHLFLLDLSNKDITGKEAEKLLESADITVNKNCVPGEKRSPFITSGIRIGTSAITTRGMKNPEQIVFWIDSLITDRSEDNIARVRSDVNSVMSKLPIFKHETL